MSISNRRGCRAYFLITAALAVFSFVYESLSHGVISKFMVFLCLFPLLGGALPLLIFGKTQRARATVWLARCLYHSGLATLTVASCVTGVLEIYGTASDYTPVFWVVGAAFMAAGVVLSWWRTQKPHGDQSCHTLHDA